MEKTAKPAVLHVFDGATGKELFSSGTAATTFAPSGIGLANGRVYFTTHDSTLFAYGVPFER
jgi:outer membrane protein assembly factor BamB